MLTLLTAVALAGAPSLDLDAGLQTWGTQRTVLPNVDRARGTTLGLSTRAALVLRDVVVVGAQIDHLHTRYAQQGISAAGTLDQTTALALAGARWSPRLRLGPHAEATIGAGVALPAGPEDDQRVGPVVAGQATLGVRAGDGPVHGVVGARGDLRRVLVPRTSIVHVMAPPQLRDRGLSLSIVAGVGFDL